MSDWWLFTCLRAHAFKSFSLDVGQTVVWYSSIDDDLCIWTEWTIIIGIELKMVGGVHMQSSMMDIAVNEVNHVPSLIFDSVQYLMNGVRLSMINLIKWINYCENVKFVRILTGAQSIDYGVNEVEEPFSIHLNRSFKKLLKWNGFDSKFSKKPLRIPDWKCPQNCRVVVNCSPISTTILEWMRTPAFVAHEFVRFWPFFDYSLRKTKQNQLDFPFCIEFVSFFPHSVANMFIC